MAAKYADKGLVVVGPSLDAEASVKKFKGKHGIGYPLIASSKKIAAAYGVELYPTAFVVGKDGKILFKGDVDEPGCIKALESALNAK